MKLRRNVESPGPLLQAVRRRQLARERRAGPGRFERVELKPELLKDAGHDRVPAPRVRR